MGVRIEHPQRDVDRVQYGASAGHPALGQPLTARRPSSQRPQRVLVLHVPRRAGCRRLFRAGPPVRQRRQSQCPRRTQRKCRPAR
ncbi:MAG: hypothetical protein ACLU37_01665 [Collinsella sp.]